MAYTHLTLEDRNYIEMRLLRILNNLNSDSGRT